MQSQHTLELRTLGRFSFPYKFLQRPFNFPDNYNRQNELKRTFQKNFSIKRDLFCQFGGWLLAFFVKKRYNMVESKNGVEI
jgi:hypothetical protein